MTQITTNQKMYNNPTKPVLLVTLMVRATMLHWEQNLTLNVIVFFNSFFISHFSVQVYFSYLMYSPEGFDFSHVLFFLPSSCQIVHSHLVGHMLSLGSSQFTVGDNCQPEFSSEQFSLLSVHFKKHLRMVGCSKQSDTHLIVITPSPQWDVVRK